MSEESNVVDLVEAAKKRGRTLPNLAPATVQISGNNNVGVAGDGNSIQINVKPSSRKQVRVTVERGPADITAAQAAEIQELVARVVALSGRAYSEVWPILKRKFRFASYHLIPHEQFEDVRAYLRKWIASVSSPGDSTAPAARKRALSRIHAEAKKVPGMLDRVHAYIHGRFGTKSLGDLAPGQLHEVIRQFNF